MLQKKVRRLEVLEGLAIFVIGMLYGAALFAGLMGCVYVFQQAFSTGGWWVIAMLGMVFFSLAGGALAVLGDSKEG